jgi:hypothetical protein
MFYGAFDILSDTFPLSIFRMPLFFIWRFAQLHLMAPISVSHSLGVSEESYSLTPYSHRPNSELLILGNREDASIGIHLRHNSIAHSHGPRHIRCQYHRNVSAVSITQIVGLRSVESRRG